MDLKLFWIVLKWNEHVRTRFERSKWSGFWIPRPGKSVQPRFQNHFRLNPLRSNPKNHTHSPRNQNPSGSKNNSLYPFYNFGYCFLIQVNGSELKFVKDIVVKSSFWIESHFWYLVLISLLKSKVLNIKGIFKLQFWLENRPFFS